MRRAGMPLLRIQFGAFEFCIAAFDAHHIILVFRNSETDRQITVFFGFERLLRHNLSVVACHNLYQALAFGFENRGICTGFQSQPLEYRLSCIYFSSSTRYFSLAFAAPVATSVFKIPVQYSGT